MFISLDSIRDRGWVLAQSSFGRYSKIMLGVIDPTDQNTLVQQLTPWEIEGKLERIGPLTDGGYVILKDRILPDAVISLGVGNTSEFEKHFADFGVPCILVDATIDSPPITNRNFRFVKSFAGLKIRGPEYVSLDELIVQNDLSDSRNLLAQIDIEGSEYEVVLSSAHQTLDKFRQIVIECHDTLSFLTPQGRRLWDIFFNHISQTHTLIHTHANNCCPPIRLRGFNWPNVIELSFVRNDLANKVGRVPLGTQSSLDAKNDERKKWRYFEA